MSGVQNQKVESSGSGSWLSAAILFAPLSFLGEQLIARTNHRPLGAATFATLALLMWVVTEIVVNRALDPRVSLTRKRLRRMTWIGSLMLACGVLARAMM